jgi:bilirubin oxidase
MRKRMLLATLLLFSYEISWAQVVNFIPIPDTLSGAQLNLNVHEGGMNFFTGATSNTFGVNQYSYLGPTLILNQGQDVSISLNNALGDTTNMHWHGLQVPAMSDGPMTEVVNGESWNTMFNVVNRSGTYWYHPHLHKKTALQALKGAAGMIIVRDSEEAQLALPRKYGTDDFPIIVQSIQFDTLNQCMPRGMQDSTIFVNGVRANYGFEAALNVPAQVVRLRLLNASGERTFNFGFSNNFSFSVIASDGGLLNNPFSTTRVRLSPGERYEILLNLSGLEGSDLYLMSYASELPTGVQGGPTMNMPAGSEPMDSPINGVNFNVLHLVVNAPTFNPIVSVPSTLSNIVTYNANESLLQRNILMSAQSMISMDGPFFFNNLSYDMNRIDYYIPINNIEIWQLQNQTMVAHPFHIHDVSFTVLSRDGNLPGVQERGMKDVVLIESQETVRVIAKFDVYSDTVTPYVYHCHILMHEDDGMMGQFLVVPEGYVNLEDPLIESLSFAVYPNPTSNEVKLDLTQFYSRIFDMKIFDAEGRVVLDLKNSSESLFSVSDLKSGSYFIVVRSGESFYHSRFLKQ